MSKLVRGGLLAAMLVFACGTSLAKPPNMVFILADDLDAAAAAQMVQVKSMLAEQGADFKRHYVSLSLCCPSRVTTLRGQFAHNTTIFKNELPDGGFGKTYELGLENSTVATWLQGAGYRTALFGKYLNGYPEGAPSSAYIPPGWTEWMSPNAGTPYKNFNYTMNHNGVPESYGSADGDYLTDVISRAASDFIRRSVEQHPEQAFFVYLAPYAPHAPAIPAPRHSGAFKGIKAPRTVSFNESDVTDKPSWVRTLPLLTSTQVKAMDKLYVKRRQSLLAVDELVQSVVNTLQSVGELGNTYVFFTSDNGYHQGQHRLDSGKMSAFEEDIIVPLFVRGPGVAPGLAITQITANVDYASTFAAMAGVNTPSFVDGRSFLPLLLGQTPPPWRQALLLEHKSAPSEPFRGPGSPLEPSDPFDGQVGLGGTISGFTGLRLADGTTYLEYEVNEFELYDNNLDSAQLRNSYATTPPQTRQRLAGWLASLKSLAGEQLRQAELQPP
ncbi:sulfatase-like hydrolase/transferase [Ideonella sp. YS5]|uniref:sulfatase family protein n=1 Tax=Ideonella sp. YS5 TaxID=3453714 RepID=UPI003EE823E6